MSDAQPLARPASLVEVFVAFTAIALQGFGGVVAISQRVLCDEKRWLSSVQYVELLAIGQMLPGPSVCNLALLVGDRFFGWRGAAVALAGIMAAPFVIVLALTAVYAQFAFLPAVDGALRGMGAAAAGLIVGTGLKLAHTLQKNVLRLPVCIAIGAATFVGVALLRLPLIWICLGIGALAWSFAWRRLAPTPGDRP